MCWCILLSEWKVQKGMLDGLVWKLVVSITGLAFVPSLYRIISRFLSWKETRNLSCFFFLKRMHVSFTQYRPLSYGNMQSFLWLFLILEAVGVGNRKDSVLWSLPSSPKGKRKWKRKAKSAILFHVIDASMWIFFFSFYNEATFKALRLARKYKQISLLYHEEKLAFDT